MTVTYQDVTLVRLYITDTATTPADRLLTDEQIVGLINAAGGSLYLAAASALESIAVSEVLVSKKIRTQDLSTDGPAVADALVKLADRYRARARAAGEDPTFDDGDVFDIATTLPAGTRPEHTGHEVWGL